MDSLNLSGLRNCIVRDGRHENASINVFKVVGTQHPDYVGGTRLDLLMKGERREQDLKMFVENPFCYHESVTKVPYMHCVSYDGDGIFIGDEGNHRTCVVRFFFHAADNAICMV